MMNILTVGAAYDTTDSALRAMAEALLKQVEGTGIRLLAICREGATLEAIVDDGQADEPLCPMAFARVVRKLSHALLGEVWEGRLLIDLTPAPTPEPAVVLARVA